MNEFQFASPHYLLLLGLLPLLGFGLSRIDRDARSRLLRFLSETNLRQLLQDKGTFKDRSKRAAFWLGLSLMILALARPQANPIVEETKSSGLDIYVLLDVSKSMDAEDVAPSRLKKAKKTIQHLTARLSGDRVGIIAFANSAVLVSPLTNDYSIIDSYLQNIDTSIVPSQGTNLGHALDVAKEAMERGAKSTGPDNERSNIFLVLSDGEDHGDSDLSIVDGIHKSGGIVFTIAFGTEKGGTIPVRDDRGELRGHKTDPTGKEVVTAVKTEVLKETAKRGGGVFYFSTQEEAEVEDLLARVNDAQRSSFTTVKTVVYDELFWIFLAPGLFALLYSFLPLLALAKIALAKAKTGNWRDLFPKRIVKAWVVFSIGLACSSAEAGPISFFWSKERRASEESQALAKDKKYSDAVDSLKGLQAENPDNPDLNYNIGTYLLMDQKGRMGREQLDHLRNADGPLRDLAQFNAAGSLAMEGKKPEARAAYAELLQRLQRKEKLSESEAQLLAQTKRNVARLADPSQQPPPQQDKSEQQQQKQDQDKSDQKQDKGQDSKNPQQGGGGKDKQEQKEPNKGDNKDQGKGDQKDDKNKNEGDKNKDKGGADGDRKNQDKKDGDKDKQEEKKQDPGKEGEGKGKGDQSKNQTPVPAGRGSQPFKDRDNMGEEEAKRILGGLKERESDLQKKFLKNKVKGGKVNVDDAAKDW